MPSTTGKAVAMLALCATFAWLWLLVNRAGAPHHPVASCGRPPPADGPWGGQRVAWIVPYLPAPSLPAYASLFLRTVAASSPHLHLFLFYENATMLLPQVESDNIHFISLGPGEIAERLWKAFRQELGEEAVGEKALIELRKTFTASAATMGSYKPILGAAFHDYIGTRLLLSATAHLFEGYSHWAWGDIDTLVGDMGRLIRAEDLRQFDIITLTQGKGWLYLFGQFTIFANRPELLEAWKWVPNVVALANVNVAQTVEGLPKGMPWAWDEIAFSDWVNHNSSLFVKMLPAQIWGQEGYRDPAWVPKHTLVWADGRLLVHSTSPERWELPARVEAPLLWQDTWAEPGQRPGPYIVERRGTNNNTVWYDGSNREAAGYGACTQEYALFHYNYEHEFKIPSDLAAKRESELSAEGREELRELIKAPRLTWRYSPFDFFPAPPCDTPGGGYCPLAPATPPTTPKNEDDDQQERTRGV